MVLIIIKIINNFNNSRSNNSIITNNNKIKNSKIPTMDYNQTIKSFFILLFYIILNNKIYYL